jgi:hypothetical protein
MTWTRKLQLCPAAAAVVMLQFPNYCRADHLLVLVLTELLCHCLVVRMLLHALAPWLPEILVPLLRLLALQLMRPSSLSSS